ncbi:hypothetical protein BRADI_4g37919v3 [Brachypodium distachyon]|uniref:Reverse transcriptase zinc-binding domain-containing protein n=1 Tax=Brachypodium distachyon TaxID=15368 RepID=A0A0Q3IZ98_BRADI|nr:hypothetical protein BRADI_4g37919v3 [Brachypodium distachyon]
MKLERGDADLSCVLIRRKYLGVNGFFQSSLSRASQFSKGLHAVKKWFSVGSSYKVGNGRTEFHGGGGVGRGEICLSFRSSLGDAESDEWTALSALLRGVVLNAVPDVARWELTANKCFTTKSMYMAISHSGVVDLQIMDLWRATIPLKEQIFTWMCFRGRIQVIFKAVAFLGHRKILLPDKRRAATLNLIAKLQTNLRVAPAQGIG